MVFCRGGWRAGLRDDISGGAAKKRERPGRLFVPVVYTQSTTVLRTKQYAKSIAPAFCVQNLNSGAAMRRLPALQFRSSSKPAADTQMGRMWWGGIYRNKGNEKTRLLRKAASFLLAFLCSIFHSKRNDHDSWRSKLERRKRCGSEKKEEVIALQ